MGEYSGGEHVVPTLNDQEPLVEHSKPPERVMGGEGAQTNSINCPITGEAAKLLMDLSHDTSLLQSRGLNGDLTVWGHVEAQLSRSIGGDEFYTGGRIGTRIYIDPHDGQTYFENYNSTVPQGGGTETDSRDNQSRYRVAVTTDGNQPILDLTEIWRGSRADSFEKDSENIPQWIRDISRETITQTVVSHLESELTTSLKNTKNLKTDSIPGSEYLKQVESLQHSLNNPNLSSEDKEKISTQIKEVISADKVAEIINRTVEQAGIDKVELNGVANVLKPKSEVLQEQIDAMYQLATESVVENSRYLYDGVPDRITEQLSELERYWGITQDSNTDIQAQPLADAAPMKKGFLNNAREWVTRFLGLNRSRENKLSLEDPYQMLRDLCVIDQLDSTKKASQLLPGEIVANYTGNLTQLEDILRRAQEKNKSGSTTIAAKLDGETINVSISHTGIFCFERTLQGGSIVHELVGVCRFSSGHFKVFLNTLPGGNFDKPARPETSEPLINYRQPEDNFPRKYTTEIPQIILPKLPLAS